MIELHYQLDEKSITELIDEAAELQDNQALFNKLAEIARVKQAFNDVAELIEKQERDIKAAINSKARALYGPNWNAIKGEGYKITRSHTGSIYEITGKPPKELVEIKQSVKSKLVDEYVKAKGKLPKGISYNPKRGDRITITVNGDV